MSLPYPVRVAAGVALAALLLVAVYGAICFYVSVEPFRRAPTDEDFAVSGLKTVAVAETIYKEDAKYGNGKHVFASLEELAAARIIDSVLGSGTKSHYVFRVEPGTDPTRTWWAVARPLAPDPERRHVFFANQTGVVFELPVGAPNASASPDAMTGAPPSGATPVSR